MALQKCGLNLDRMKRELLPHGTPDFPCAGYEEAYEEGPEEAIPWHWHEELEIAYVKRGRLTVKVPGARYILEEGDGILINSNVLHSASAAPACLLRSLVFHGNLVAGNEGSVFAAKYLRPLTGDAAPSARPLFLRECPEEAAFFAGAFDAMKEEPPGFEITVREKLTWLCFHLSRRSAGEPSGSAAELSMDNVRIREMLAFIHGHFSEKLCLEEIAAAAHISGRECLRCFQRTIKNSPVQYLMKYRLMQAADLLRLEPAGSITGIASACGFDSPGYFARMFRRYYGCTPREYRKQADPGGAGGTGTESPVDFT